eukprot:CAMPEP_0197864966 /NCGR_PEP_ID=MMETSP1438-20131217/43388_1 /TAXON_ID=1461541 /ORGANISM="Pterosperma sp., Strain CCMP1384" /LENGTH=817 /DNA_ID=CAMNT_0043483351 /DNA_START=3249 /DNA_END=5702 /DNA_ORIENTATION=-
MSSNVNDPLSDSWNPAIANTRSLIMQLASVQEWNYECAAYVISRLLPALTVPDPRSSHHQCRVVIAWPRTGDGALVRDDDFQHHDLGIYIPIELWVTREGADENWLNHLRCTLPWYQSQLGQTYTEPIENVVDSTESIYGTVLALRNYTREGLRVRVVNVRLVNKITETHHLDTGHSFFGRTVLEWDNTTPQPEVTLPAYEHVQPAVTVVGARYTVPQMIANIEHQVAGHTAPTTASTNLWDPFNSIGLGLRSTPQHNEPIRQPGVVNTSTLATPFVQGLPSLSMVHANQPAHAAQTPLQYSNVPSLSVGQPVHVVEQGVLARHGLQLQPQWQYGTTSGLYYDPELLGYTQGNNYNYGQGYNPDNQNHTQNYKRLWNNHCSIPYNMTDEDLSEFYELLDMVFNMCFRECKRYTGGRFSDYKFFEFFQFQRGVKNMLQHRMLESKVNDGFTGLIIDYILNKVVKEPLSSHFARLKQNDPKDYDKVTQSVETLLEFVLDKVTDSTQAVDYADDAINEIQQQKLDVEELREQLERLQEACAVLKKHKGHGEFTNQNMRDKFLQLVDIPIRIKLSAKMLEWRSLSDSEKWTQMGLTALQKQQELYHLKQWDKDPSQGECESPAIEAARSISKSKSQLSRDKRLGRSLERSILKKRPRKLARPPAKSKLKEVNFDDNIEFINIATHNISLLQTHRQIRIENQCHGCGKKGHVRKDCPSHKPDTPSTKGLGPKFRPRPLVSCMTGTSEILKYLNHLVHDQAYSTTELHAVLAHDYDGHVWKSLHKPSADQQAESLSSQGVNYTSRVETDQDRTRGKVKMKFLY